MNQKFDPVKIRSRKWTQILCIITNKRLIAPSMMDRQYQPLKCWRVYSQTARAPLTCTLSDRMMPNWGISIQLSRKWMRSAGIPSRSLLKKRENVSFTVMATTSRQHVLISGISQTKYRSALSKWQNNWMKQPKQSQWQPKQNSLKTLSISITASWEVRP